KANAQLVRINSYFGSLDIGRFLVIVWVGNLLVVLLSAVVRRLDLYTMIWCSLMRTHSISTLLLQTYLRRPYAFFLNRHSGDLGKSILSEAGEVVNRVYLPYLRLSASGLTLVFLAILVTLVNPLAALGTGAVLGGSYAV